MPDNGSLPEHIQELIIEREEVEQRAKEIDQELRDWADTVQQKLAAVGVPFGPKWRERGHPQVAEEVTGARPPTGMSQAQIVVEAASRVGKPVGVDHIAAVLDAWGIDIARSSIRSYLSQGVKEGSLERIARGQYVAVYGEHLDTPEMPAGEYSDVSVRDAVIDILQREGGSLHLKEVQARLKSSGKVLGGKSPYQTLQGTIRSYEDFVNLGKNTWDLAKRHRAGPDEVGVL